MRPLNLFESVVFLLSDNLDILPAVGGAVEELLSDDVVVHARAEVDILEQELPTAGCPSDQVTVALVDVGDVSVETSTGHPQVAVAWVSGHIARNIESSLNLAKIFDEPGVDDSYTFHVTRGVQAESRCEFSGVSLEQAILN